VILAAPSFPPPEFIIFAVAILIGLIGRIVSFAKKIRERSIEAQRDQEQPFGAELDEAPEPTPAPMMRLELVRRPPRPRFEESAPSEPPTPRRPAPAAPAPRPRREHEIVRLLRSPKGARSAVILAEVLGSPKAFRRGR
jgi:hypothetical protein